MNLLYLFFRKKFTFTSVTCFFLLFRIMSRLKKTCVLLVVGFYLGYMFTSRTYEDTVDRLKQTVALYLRRTEAVFNNVTAYHNNSSPYRTMISNKKNNHFTLSQLSHRAQGSDGWNLVFSRNRTIWKVQPSMCSRNTTGFYRSKLRTNVGSTTIYIYDPRKDIWVSREIIRYGSWEGTHINLILSLLQQDPDLHFVDIGSNVGVFTLAVALLGRRVLAVDALAMNIMRLCSSVIEGNFTDSVQIVYNAFSDVYETVSLGMDENNVGGTFVAKDKNTNKVIGSRVVGNYGTVQTIRLNDVLSLPRFDFTKVIMKIDVEGYENKVFKGGETFFDKVDVRAVLMEWQWLKTGNAGQEIINFMLLKNMEPHVPEQNPRPLKIQDRGNWPNDILWRKKPLIKTR